MRLTLQSMKLGEVVWHQLDLNKEQYHCNFCGLSWPDFLLATDAARISLAASDRLNFAILKISLIYIGYLYLKFFYE